MYSRQKNETAIIYRQLPLPGPPFGSTADEDPNNQTILCSGHVKKKQQAKTISDNEKKTYRSCLYFFKAIPNNNCCREGKKTGHPITIRAGAIEKSRQDPLAVEGSSSRAQLRELPLNGARNPRALSEPQTGPFDFPPARHTRILCKTAKKAEGRVSTLATTFSIS